VFEVGLTVWVLPVPPIDHEYVVAPVAVSVALCPLQIEGLLTFTLGNGVTVIVDVAELEQPGEVTVYVVVLVGLTVTLEPDIPPGLQEYVADPEAVSVEDWPAQMLAGEGVIDSVEGAFTVIVVEDDALQAPDPTL
jgi:hypothetical protein